MTQLLTTLTLAIALTAPAHPSPWPYGSGPSGDPTPDTVAGGASRLGPEPRGPRVPQPFPGHP